MKNVAGCSSIRQAISHTRSQLTSIWLGPQASVGPGLYSQQTEVNSIPVEDVLSSIIADGLGERSLRELNELLVVFDGVANRTNPMSTTASCCFHQANNIPTPHILCRLCDSGIS